ncbi:helix-turn-helix domain-containing protein [Rhizobium rhizogenes]|uniref:helix-turn-helix domain-containing protein n=1 Tax=Rhizobium rhizogenes TaxID=359 RepID=UPI0015749468|nr:helix-turn-helix domain-containing protein [Rhizobium rhizogenes]NTF65776.1 hypothetical protein [Rhizobium rhizogenes]NTG97129.1 hypothetical protein [Rhizobium rhizogenes]
MVTRETIDQHTITHESRNHPADDEGTLAAQCIAALLLRHGIPKYRHAVTVSEVLGLSYSAGNRRLTMNASWSLEELKRVAEHFNETLPELVSLAKADSMVDATTVMNNHIIPCKIRLGNPVAQVAVGTLIATEVEGAWRVMPADGKPMIHTLSVTRMVVEPVTPSRRVAVLDDHDDTAQSIARHIQIAGFEAVTYSRLTNLEDKDYDAYVLDWIIEADSRRQTAFELIRNIRARNAFCPIFVLTGQIANGGADEQHIASAMTTYNLKYFQKPLSIPILISALNSSFKAA